MIVRFIVEALSDVAIVKQVIHDPEGIVAQFLGYRPQGQDVLRVGYARVIGNGHTKFESFLPDMAAKRLQGSAALISRGTWYHFSTAEANAGDSAMSWRIVLPSGPYNQITERGDQAMSAITNIAHGLRFPEGPIAMLDGAVVLVEIERQTLSCVHPNGEV